jgi:hypothetical protein
MNWNQINDGAYDEVIAFRQCSFAMDMAVLFSD